MEFRGTSAYASVLLSSVHTSDSVLMQRILFEEREKMFDVAFKMETEETEPRNRTNKSMAA